MRAIREILATPDKPNPKDPSQANVRQERHTRGVKFGVAEKEASAPAMRTYAVAEKEASAPATRSVIDVEAAGGGSPFGGGCAQSAQKPTQRISKQKPKEFGWRA